MDKITKLSQAIRYGSTFLDESQLWMGRRQRNGSWKCGCALGTAYLAVVDAKAPVLMASEDIYPVLAKRFGVPTHVLEKVSFDHYNGKRTRAQCADWLEARGY